MYLWTTILRGLKMSAFKREIIVFVLFASCLIQVTDGQPIHLMINKEGFDPTHPGYFEVGIFNGEVSDKYITMDIHYRDPSNRNLVGPYYIDSTDPAQGYTHLTSWSYFLAKQGEQSLFYSNLNSPSGTKEVAYRIFWFDGSKWNNLRDANDGQWYYYTLP
jgi:hypothetical protein